MPCPYGFFHCLRFVFATKIERNSRLRLGRPRASFSEQKANWRSTERRDKTQWPGGASPAPTKSSFATADVVVLLEGAACRRVYLLFLAHQRR
jgi:hypothetical protein